MNSMQQEVSNPRMQAEALKRMGRGPDTQLIHMTDSEIGALNGLSGLVFNEPLRTNPETGLPEAGLFKQLLPTVLAIGAGAFLGPAAAGLFGKGALAMGVGTGLAAGAGHLAGQAVTGQDLDFGRALLAGAGSGLTAGLTFDPGAAAVGTGTIDPTMATKAGAINPNLDVPASLGDYGGAVVSPGTLVPAPAGADAIYGGFSTAGDGGVQSLQSFSDAGNRFLDMPLGSTEVATGPGGMRTFSEGFDYLAADPMKRVLLPLAVPALSGELDEPLPEAPAGPSRTPFTPKDFDFTRSRRDIDRDEDGEVTQADILEVVQGLPEGQSSRFYTPGVFTEAAKEGGLLRLKTGGNIQEAIGALTGGGGASVLPMIAQSVVKPEDEEEEESISKGYPVGKAGTAPGAATTGMAIGGGQPPQPFQTGGPTALELALSDGTGAGGFGTGTGPGGTAPSSTSSEASLEGNVSTAGQRAGSALGSLFGPPVIGSVVGSLIGSEISQAANKSAAEAAFDKGDTFAAPVGFANPEGVPNINTTQSFLSHIPVVGNFFDSRAQQTAQNTKAANETLLTEQALTGLPTKEQQLEAEAEAEAEAQEGFNAAMGLASLAMAEEDAPEDTEPGNPGVPGSQASVAQGIASLASQAMDTFVEGPAGSGDGGSGSGDDGFGSGSGPGSGFGDEGFGGIGGEESDGSGSGSGDADASGSGDDGEGGGPAGDKTGGLLAKINTPLGDPYEQGGYLGGASGRAYGGLLQLAGGGSVPYFEGRVMPTGNMTEDGMSDNIPFVIAGRQGGGQMGMQPAVLSPDEYVIPADVVSMLGNGSSNAGANDLDQFINNFRMDKYGRPKQPPEMSGGLSSLA